MTPIPSTPERGRGVEEDFTLPWNTRTLAEVWAAEDAEERKRDRAIVRQIRQITYRPTHLTSRGKVKFAGYDKSEKQFHRGK